MADYSHLKLEPLTPHIGAEVLGVDLARPLEPEALAELKRAFAEWMVLVFRGQRLTREQHKAVGRAFGRLHVHPMHHAGSARGYDDPEILLVKTTATSKYTAGEGWHSDVSCDEIPPLGSMLYVTEVPPGGGGDTLFADMCLAYELLSPAMQRFLTGLSAVHDGALPYVGAYGSKPPEGGYPRSAHPVVTTHPETGRKVLFVNSGFTSHIPELTRSESRALLDFLFKHVAETPKLTCRVRWEPGTLTFWDNRSTQHHAIWDYYPHTRYGERVSIVGEQRPQA